MANPTVSAGTIDQVPSKALKKKPSHGGIHGSPMAASAFLLPILAVFLVLFAIPLAQIFYYSFTDYKGLSRTVKFIGFDNYKAIFSNSFLLESLSFTVLFAVATTLLITAFAIPLAVVLNRKFFGRNFSRSVLFFLGVPSQAILGLVWQYIFSPLDSGALNSILTRFGLDTVPWLADSGLAQFCVIFVAIWAGVGWHATLYLAYLQAIPADLYESADVDGATKLQQFFFITVPQLIPAIVVSSFLLITSGLKIFDLPFAMTKGGPGYATNTVTQAIIVQGVSQGNIGLGSALAVLFTIVSVAVVLAQLALVNTITKRYT